MNKLWWDTGMIRRNAGYIFVLLCIAVLVHELFGQHGILALRREQKEIQGLRQQIHDLQQENGQLSKQIKALQSDPKAIERLAREQMHMSRPGEIIYTLPEKPTKKEQSPPVVQDGPPK